MNRTLCGSIYATISWRDQTLSDQPRYTVELTLPTAATPLQEDGPVRDIVEFFAIGYAIAWAAADAGVDSDTFIGLVEAGELGDLQTPVPAWVLYLLSRVIDFSFSIAGVTMIAVTAGTAGLRQLGRRLTAWRLAPRWYAMALLPVALYAVAAAVITSSEGGEVLLDLSVLRSILFSLSAGLLVSLFLRGAMAEELGLRGFVLPRLQARTTPFNASLLIGTLWGLWHLPVLLGRDLGSILVYLLFVYALTFLFTWLFNHTYWSLVPVLLLHATVNWEEGIETVFPAVRGTDWETLPVIGLMLVGIAAAVHLRRNPMAQMDKPTQGVLETIIGDLHLRLDARVSTKRGAVSCRPVLRRGRRGPPPVLVG